MTLLTIAIFLGTSAAVLQLVIVNNKLDVIIEELKKLNQRKP